MIRKDALKVYGEEFKKHGLKKHGNVWYQRYSDITVLIHIQHSLYDQETYYINMGIALNKTMKNDYPVYKNGDWLIQFRISVYDYENDGLGIDPLERTMNLKKLSQEQQNQIKQKISQPDPYEVIDKVMIYFQKITTIEELLEFIVTSQECQNYNHDYILSKINSLINIS